MTSYLLTTALLSVGMDSPVISAAVQPIDFTLPTQIQELRTEAVQTNASYEFVNGDFTAISKAALNGGLYTGDGAVEMVSARIWLH